MLNDVRKKINDIDEEMISLFIKRMKLVEEVLKFKKDNNLEVLDVKREEELLKRNLLMLNDNELEKYYKIFFDAILRSSKTFQEDNL